MRFASLVLVTTLLAPGCSAAEAETARAPAPAMPIAALRLLARLPLAPGNPPGLSGLARAGDGTLWAVPERARLLVPLRVHELGLAARRPPVPLGGVPFGTDTESVAWLGEGELAFGTETQRSRGEDLILFARVGEVAEVTDSVTLPYAGWGLRAAVNRGVEGLCAAGGVLLAGVEMVLERGGRRFAPLARYDRATRRWSYGRVALASRTGKIASLDCRLSGEAELEVVAIERHYGTAWLLRFVAPLGGELGELWPTAVTDLGPLVPGVPNLEGVVFLPDERLAVIVDNDTGGVSGPTELLLFAPARR